MPDTVCVSSTRGVEPRFTLVDSSERWYVNVKGGSPISSKRISAWSPVGGLCVSKTNWRTAMRGIPSRMSCITFFPCETFAEGILWIRKLKSAIVF